MSTGAACLVLADEETAFKISDDPIKLTMGAGSHTLRTADRRDDFDEVYDFSLAFDRDYPWPGQRT